jgi:hypothetical protein
LIVSCTSQKIQIQVQVFKPYCGGAKPTPIQAEGILYAAAGMSLDLFCVDKKGSRKVKRIALDDKGIWDGTLAQGEYILKQADKGLSLTALKVKYHLNDTLNNKYIGDKKLDQWTKETDFNLNVVASDTLRKDFVLKEKCFVGLNPCFEYIGPKPR